MATIDPRLLPLIETLLGSGADWLAFEILDGIRFGRPAEESEEEIREARNAVHLFRRNKKTSPPEIKARKTVVESIEGDEQINFAATYVFDRIAQAIEMAIASLQQLNGITSQSDGRSEPAGVGSEYDTSIYIRSEGGDTISSQNQSEEALNRLTELRKALLEWSQSARQGEREA